MDSARTMMFTNMCWSFLEDLAVKLHPKKSSFQLFWIIFHDNRHFKSLNAIKIEFVLESVMRKKI